MRATPTTANRVLSTLSRMFALAELWEMRPEGSNPCRNVKHFREEPRERFFSDEKYRRLGEVLKEVEREGSERPSAIAGLRGMEREDGNPWVIAGAKPGEALSDCLRPVAPHPQPRRTGRRAPS